MAQLRIRLSPHYFGAFGGGTETAVHDLANGLGLSRQAAQACVDRCVLGEETVTLPVDSEATARALASRLNEAPMSPVRASVLVD